MTPLVVTLCIALTGIVGFIIWTDSGYEEVEDIDLDIEPFEFDEVCQQELDRHISVLMYYKRCRIREKDIYNRDERYMMWSEWFVEAMRLGPHYVGRTPEEVVAVVNRRIAELMFLKS